MKRREFITLLSGAAVAWPVVARAQQSLGERMRRVAILIAYPPTDVEMQARVRALRQELGRLGWTSGSNIQFDERWTTDNMDLVRVNAAGLLELKPDVVVTFGGRVVPVVMQLTRSVPIVVAGAGDPVFTGWVESLAKPGGNVTGFTFFESSVIVKYLELLKQIVPGISRVAAVYNPDNRLAEKYARIFEASARTAAIEPILAPIRGIGDIDRAIESLAQSHSGGAFFLPDLTVTALREQVAAVVARHRVPAVYSDRIMVLSGGLASYDTDRVDLFRRSASYVDRVLRGEKPGDLPFQQPTKYQLTINLRTAKAMGLEIPTSVVALADEVIE